MRDSFRTRRRRFTFAFTVALALIAAMPAAANAEGCSGTPTAPMAIDRNVFNGKMKGLVGANEIIVSTRLSNAAWTGFFFSATNATVTAFVNDPVNIPALHCGDLITLGSGNSGSAYAAMEAKWPAGSVIVLPIASFDGGRGAVAGFAVVQVITIQASGSPKYLHGTILSLDLDPAA